MISSGRLLLLLAILAAGKRPRLAYHLALFWSAALVWVAGYLGGTPVYGVEHDAW